MLDVESSRRRLDQFDDSSHGALERPIAGDQPRSRKACFEFTHELLPRGTHQDRTDTPCTLRDQHRSER